MLSKISLFFGILFLSFLQTCNPITIKKDMVQFDQAFIPVWVLSQQGDVEGARLAMSILEREWTEFQKVKGEIPAHHRDLHEVFARTDGWLKDAADALDQCNLFMALNQLDHARYEISEWREMSEIEYYLDPLWEFEAVLDIALVTASDPMLDLMEWNEIQCMVEDLDFYWQAALSTKLDKDLFEIPDEAQPLINYQQKAISSGIEDVIKSMACGDSSPLANSIKRVEPMFLNYLSNFGNFDPVIREKEIQHFYTQN